MTFEDLKEQPLERAEEIALALEVYVNGSLSMFAKPTNVDMTNRLICFNIQSSGRSAEGGSHVVTCWNSSTPV